MSVQIEQIRPGAVFRFKTAARRVVGVEVVGSGANVHWEYADGKKRGGRTSGRQWIHYFRTEAIEQIPDPALAGETRALLSGRQVPARKDTVGISLVTHCPSKWAMVDLETGELWGHDGLQFERLSPAGAAEVAKVAKRAASAGRADQEGGRDGADC